MDYNFPVTRTTTPKEKPTDCKSLGFGKYFTDHMLIMDYDEGQGWHDSLYGMQIGKLPDEMGNWIVRI